MQDERLNVETLLERVGATVTSAVGHKKPTATVTPRNSAASSTPLEGESQEGEEKTKPKNKKKKKMGRYCVVA